MDDEASKDDLLREWHQHPTTQASREYYENERNTAIIMLAQMSVNSEDPKLVALGTKLNMLERSIVLCGGEPRYFPKERKK